MSGAAFIFYITVLVTWFMSRVMQLLYACLQAQAPDGSSVSSLGHGHKHVEAMRCGMLNTFEIGQWGFRGFKSVRGAGTHWAWHTEFMSSGPDSCRLDHLKAPAASQRSVRQQHPNKNFCMDRLSVKCCDHAVKLLLVAVQSEECC